MPDASTNCAVYFTVELVGAELTPMTVAPGAVGVVGVVVAPGKAGKLPKGPLVVLNS